MTCPCVTLTVTETLVNVVQLAAMGGSCAGSDFTNMIVLPGPAGPAAPVAPGAPLRPGRPCAPVAPAGPWSPWAPVAPVGPCAPVAPVAPPCAISNQSALGGCVVVVLNAT